MACFYNVVVNHKAGMLSESGHYKNTGSIPELTKTFMNWLFFQTAQI